MERLIKFLTGEELIIVFLALIILVCSYGPLVYQYLFPPPGKVFLGSFGFPGDFFANIVYFQSGRLGHWQYQSKITSTVSSQPSLVKFDYLLLGQLSRLFPLDPIIFFHLVRAALSIIFIILSYFLITQAFTSSSLRLAAFLLAFFSTSAGPGSEKLVGFWTPVGVFQRAAYHPHYLFSSIFILLALLFLCYALTKRDFLSLIGATFFGFLAAQVHPPAIMSLYFCFPFYFIFLFVYRFKIAMGEKEIWLRKLTYIAVFSLVSSLPLFYLRSVSSSHPWNLLSLVDFLYSRDKVISPIELLSGIGPTAILAICGAYLAIKKGGDFNLLIAPWAVVYIIGFFFIHKVIRYDSARFLQTPFFVILGILSTSALSRVAELLSRKKEKIVFFLALLILIASFPSYQQSFQINWQNFSHLYPYIYSSKEMFAALSWVSENSKEDEVVLTGQTNGMLVVALSGNVPYLTTFAGPLDNFTELKNNVWQFFSQNWSEKEALDFISKEGIRLVFFSQEEKKLSGGRDFLGYQFLKPVFLSRDVVVYRVILA